MTIKADITMVGKGLDRLKAMIARGADKQAAFARIYPVYQKIQVERFQSENSSETGRWKALNPDYERYKERRYGGGPRRASANRPAGQWHSYPGRGSKMLIGTGMLAGAVIGPSADSPFTEGSGQHRAIFTSDQMVISVEQSGNNPDGQPFTYPMFVAESRPFMTFGRSSLNRMRDQVVKFILEA